MYIFLITCMYVHIYIYIHHMYVYLFIFSSTAVRFSGPCPYLGLESSAGIRFRMYFEGYGHFWTYGKVPGYLEHLSRVMAWRCFGRLAELAPGCGVFWRH